VIAEPYAGGSRPRATLRGGSGLSVCRTVSFHVKLDGDGKCAKQDFGYDM
jgi:hypothetical protein